MRRARALNHYACMCCAYCMYMSAVWHDRSCHLDANVEYHAVLAESDRNQKKSEPDSHVNLEFAIFFAVTVVVLSCKWRWFNVGIQTQIDCQLRFFFPSRLAFFLMCTHIFLDAVRKPYISNLQRHYSRPPVILLLFAMCKRYVDVRVTQTPTTSISFDLFGLTQTSEWTE